MNFEDEYVQFIESHCRQRSGFSLERLQTKHGHAEKLFLMNVWWPAFHHFDGLHPEYEVYDFKDGHRYIDFAYIHPHFRIAIEVDGIGPHLRDISRWQFCEQCQRQNHLVIDGWYVLRFAYDDVKERPRLCQQTLQQIFGRLLGEVGPALRKLRFVEREIIRFAIRCEAPVTPRQVSLHLNISGDSAARYLQKLCEASWMQRVSGTRRIRSYRLHASRKDVQL